MRLRPHALLNLALLTLLCCPLTAHADVLEEIELDLFDLWAVENLESIYFMPTQVVVDSGVERPVITGIYESASLLKWVAEYNSMGVTETHTWTSFHEDDLTIQGLTTWSGNSQRHAQRITIASLNEAGIPASILWEEEGPDGWIESERLDIDAAAHTATSTLTDERGTFSATLTFDDRWRLTSAERRVEPEGYVVEWIDQSVIPNLFGALTRVRTSGSVHEMVPDSHFDLFHETSNYDPGGLLLTETGQYWMGCPSREAAKIWVAEGDPEIYWEIERVYEYDDQLNWIRMVETTTTHEGVLDESRTESRTVTREITYSEPEG